MYNFTIRNLPFVTFTTIWIIVFCLFFINPYNFENLSKDGLVVIITGLISVLLGFILSALYLKVGLNRLNSDQSVSAVRFNYKNLWHLHLITIILSFIGFVFLTLHYSSESNGLVEFLQNPIAARYKVVQLSTAVKTDWSFFLSISSYFLDFNYIASILGGILFHYNSNRIFTYASIFLGILTSIITFQRYFIIHVFMLWFFSLIITGYMISGIDKKVLRRGFVKAVIFLSLILVIFFSIIFGLRQSSDEGDLNTNKIAELIIESNYTYLAGNIIAFDKYYISNEISPYNGFSTFRDLFKWLIRAGLWDENNFINVKQEFVSVGQSELNTYTFLRNFYEDFGVFGIAILSFFWAFFGQIIFNSTLKKFSLVKLFLSTHLLFSFFMSFYGFALQNMNLIGIVFIFILLLELFIYSANELYTIEI